MRPGWRKAGPTNFAGRIKSLAIDPTNGNVLYAGAANGGVWKSTDAGANWWPLFSKQLSMAVGSVAVAAANPNVLYAATGEDVGGWGPSYDGVGVYKSTDAGTTWMLTAAGPGSRCGRVLAGASNPQHVLVASDVGLFYSNDGGGMWNLALAGHVTDVVADPADADNTFIAGVWNDGIYKSTDGGVTWHRSNGSIHAHAGSGINAGWIKVAAGRLLGTTVFVTKQGPDGGAIYRSSSGGAKWYFVAGGIEGVDYNEWTNLIACRPDNAIFLYAGGVGLQRALPASNWGAVAFTPVGGTHSDHHALVFDPGNFDICYLATDGGVYKSTDAGGTWKLSSNGLIATQLYTIGVYENGDFLLGSPTQDQGIICNRGNTGSDWVDTGAGNEGGMFVVDENNGDNAFCTPWDSTFERSTDRCANWTNLVAAIRNLGVMTDIAITAIAVRPGDSALIVAGLQNKRRRPRPHIEHDLIRSTDQGNTWSFVLTTHEYFSTLAFARGNSAVCFSGTDQGSIYRSDDVGATWAIPYAAGAAPPSNFITCLAVSWANTDVLYAGFGDYTSGSRVWKSVDRGAHWINATGGGTSTLPAIPVNALVVDDHDDQTVYAATDIGVFVTRDGGASWQDFTGGYLPGLRLPRVVVSGLGLDRTSRRLFASTIGRGAFYRPL